MKNFKLGDKVVNSKTGATGTVVPNGPYGDEEFQVRGDNGNYYMIDSFAAPGSRGYWVNAQNQDKLKMLQEMETILKRLKELRTEMVVDPKFNYNNMDDEELALHARITLDMVEGLIVRFKRKHF